MNGRNIVLGAIALGLVALIIVFFMSAGDTGGPIAEGGAKPASVVEAGGAEAPAAAPVAPVSRAEARQKKLEASGAAERKVELPEGAKPEDGGLAFGVGVCDRMTTCECQDNAADACAKGWVGVTPEEYKTASCLLDLPCEDLCRLYDRPTDVPCLVQVNEMTKKRFQSR